ncbi:hypothetical protein HK405_011878 [Cladochytrium tenue]|nr:hypothetical protein HK405_011878 [Cladochytrium tenue]
MIGATPEYGSLSQDTKSQFKEDKGCDDIRALWKYLTNRHRASQRVFEITRVRVDKLEADGRRAPEEAFSHIIEGTLVHNGSIMGRFLELVPTPATTPSPFKAPLKLRLARALALELFRAVKEHATTVGLWPYIQLARRLLTAQ